MVDGAFTYITPIGDVPQLKERGSVGRLERKE